MKIKPKTCLKLPPFSPKSEVHLASQKLPEGIWSSGMISSLGLESPGFDSLDPPYCFFLLFFFKLKIMEHNLATVVTAFFPIPSKAPASFYLEIAGRFLAKCPAKIILFTISKYVSYFHTMRSTLGNLIIYEMELDEIGLPLESPVKNWISMAIWEKTAEKFKKRAPGFGNNN